MNSISSGHVGAAALDVFVGEPKPNVVLLTHKGILSTPHIGASTNEAQERIGLEIAERVKEIMKL
jgi:D-3-phosphoglycerate dehydrogenase